jgi:hypothetical protein
MVLYSNTEQYPTALRLWGVVKLKRSYPKNQPATRMNAEQTVIFVSLSEITNHILEDLKKLSTCSGEPMAAVYADNLLLRNALATG